VTRLALIVKKTLTNKNRQDLQTHK
jgi:hypothetical protein